MKNFKPEFVLIILFFTIINGCSKNQIQKEDYKFNNYFGLNVGNTWVYQYNYYIADTLQSQDTIVFKILKDSVIYNQNAYLVETKINNGTPYFRFWNEDNGFLIEIQNLNTSGEIKQILFKSEMKKNETWQWQPTLTNNFNPNNMRIVINVNQDFPYFNYTLLASKVKNGDINTSSYEMEDLFVPYLGLLHRNIKQEVYGKIHTIEYKLIKNYNN